MALLSMAYFTSAARSLSSSVLALFILDDAIAPHTSQPAQTYIDATLMLDVDQEQVVDPRSTTSQRGGCELFTKLLLLGDTLYGKVVHRLGVGSDNV